MKKLTITLQEIKSIKKLMDDVDSLKEKSFVTDGYSCNYGNKEDIIENKELTIKNNIQIIANLLGIEFDTVVDMCYDFEFASEILNH
jgi:hypothetical protein